MKECLNCKKGFEYKRDAAKFCSGKCRVKYNRKNPSTKITRPQMQVLYNLAISALEQLKNHNTTEPHIGYQNHVKIGAFKPTGETEPLNFQRQQAASKSFEQWQAAKRECESAEDWENVKAGIEAAQNLSIKQKQLLIKYS